MTLTKKKLYLISISTIVFFIAYLIYLPISQKTLLLEVNDRKIEWNNKYIEEKSQKEKELFVQDANFISAIIAELCAVNLEYAQSFNIRKDGIATTLQPFMNNPEIFAIQVFDGSRKPFAVIWKEAGSTVFRTDYELPYALVEKIKHSVEKDVELRFTVIGKVVVYFDTNKLQERINLLKSELHNSSKKEATNLRQYFQRTYFSQTLILFLGILFMVLATWIIAKSYSLIENQRSVLKELNQKLESKVEERTRQLKEAQQELIKASKLAGMSEVATGVIHNVGNILNSVNISAGLIQKSLDNPLIKSYNSVASLLKDNLENISSFLTADPKGKFLPDYFIKFSQVLSQHLQTLKEECMTLVKNIELIKETISLQQSLAGKSSVIEEISVGEVIKEVVQLNWATMTKHHVTVEYDFKEDFKIKSDRNQLLQILINIMTNAVQALKDDDQYSVREKTVLIKYAVVGAQAVIAFKDNGPGIDSETLKNIFSYGFTTKKYGHGFGLHNSAIAAKNLGGELVAESEGKGKGATFTLTLPF